MQTPGLLQGTVNWRKIAISLIDPDTETQGKALF